MAASSSKGVTVDLVIGGATSTISLQATAVTVGKPAIITVADVTGLVQGDIITLAAGSTGFEEIDGQTWVVGNINIDENTFELVGSDLTETTGTFVADGPTMEVFGSAMTVRLCFSELTFNPETPDTISVGTFCDPSAQITSPTTSAGTMDFAGYVDINDPGYIELLNAEEDGETRWLRITLPNNGYLLFPVTISQMTFQVPVEGAVAYSGNATLNSRVRHLF